MFSLGGLGVNPWKGGEIAEVHTTLEFQRKDCFDKFFKSLMLVLYSPQQYMYSVVGSTSKDINRLLGTQFQFETF